MIHVPASLRRGLGLQLSRLRRLVLARRAVAVASAVAIVLMFGATFRGGIQHGMDQTISQEGHGRIVQGIAAVLTEKRFREGGYAISNRITGELFARGLTIDPKSPDNLRSAVFIDKVIDGMWRDVAQVPVDPNDLRGFGADDIGIVDYTKLAFALFGHHIRALYYLFFLIYGLTIAAALVERRRDPTGRLAVLCTVAIIYAVAFYSPMMKNEPAGLGALTNPRFISILSVVPLIHVLLIIAARAPATPLRVVLVGFQAAVIFFAVHVRSTAEWVPAGLLLAAAAGVAGGWRSFGRRPVGRRLAESARRAWAPILAVLIFIVSTSAVALSLHPAYKSGGWLRQHAFWHSVYYSFLFHPEFQQRYSALHDNKSGDEMPIAGIFLYLKSHPEKDTPDIYIAGKSLKYSAMETLGRAAFFDFVSRNPRFAFETFFVYKPKLFFRFAIKALRAELRRLSPAQRIAVPILVLLCSGLIGSKVTRGRFRRLCGLFAVALVPCLAIPFVTVVGTNVMSEQLVALQIGAMLLLVLAVAGATALTRQLAETRKFGAGVTVYLTHRSEGGQRRRIGRRLRLEI